MLVKCLGWHLALGTSAIDLRRRLAIQHRCRGARGRAYAVPHFLLLIDKSASWAKSPSGLFSWLAGPWCSRFADDVQRNFVQFALFLLLSWNSTMLAHAQLYAGVLGGFSSLTGDSRSLVSAGSTSFSSYDPKNGGAVEALVGVQLSDWFAVQGNYIWSSNELTLSSAQFVNGAQQGYQETRSSSQQSIMADLLVYFRKRDSRLRPYLAVGTGLVHFSSSQTHVDQLIGIPTLPPISFSSNMVGLHVPVGIDVKLGSGWAFRYTFSETISDNPIDGHLSPPGQHKLKNFQNLFGFIKRF